MQKYHLRRKEKAIEDGEELKAIIRGQKTMTLALSDGSQPYLVTMNYAFAEDQECFYFHCAQEGKKMQILRRNPLVWGQVLEDLGYIQGKCDHNYRTVQFKGKVEFLQDFEEKCHVLRMMVKQLEENPEALLERLDTNKMSTEGRQRIEKTTIGRVRVLGWSGKKYVSSSA